MHFVTLQHFICEIFGIPENVPRFLKTVFHIPDKRQLGLASLGKTLSCFVLVKPREIGKCPIMAEKLLTVT